jgi:hypothetical protein
VVLTVTEATPLRGLAQRAGEDTASKRIIVKEPGADLKVSKKSSPNPYDPFSEEYLTYTITVKNLGPGTAEGVGIEDQIPRELELFDDGGCRVFGRDRLVCSLGTLESGDDAVIVIKLWPDFEREEEFPPVIENRVDVSSDTEDPNPANNTNVERTKILFFDQRATNVELSLTSLRTTLEDDRSAGNVVLNGGRIDTTMSGAPFQHRLQAPPGKNTIEAYPTSGAGKGGLWRFDFSAAHNFLAGSIRAEVGQVVSQDAYTIVFRLSGATAERIRFSFELAP